MKRLAILATAVTVIALSIVLVTSKSREGDEARSNIIVVLIDALRRDHLGCYGYRRETSPFIDAMAEGGVLFENAIAQSPWTQASVASIFTSRYPSQLAVGAIEREGYHEISRWSALALPEEASTLAERLRDQGYWTAAISANKYAQDDFGMLQGFARKYQRNRPAQELVDTAISFLEQRRQRAEGRPFFLYIHFMDLHEPTDPPPPFGTMYETLDGKPHGEEHTRWAFTTAEDLDTEAFAVFRTHKLALYDGSLSFVDAHLERLVGYLERAGLRRDTVIAITSDHGEEFWDHAEAERVLDNDPRGVFGVGHGHTMFRELLDVPLILNGRGVPVAVVARQVRNIDIMPTLLGLAGVDPGDGIMEGEDLVGGMTHGHTADLLAFSENLAHGYEMKAIQDARYKYILGRRFELLFDRVADPLEHRDLVTENPEARERLKAEIGAIMETASPVIGQAVPIDHRMEEQLRELGYLR